MENPNEEEIPFEEKDNFTKFLYLMEASFLSIYTSELMLKIFGMGFIIGPDAYLKDYWNVLDFIIVLSAYLMMYSSDVIDITILRSFRILRPLKTVAKSGKLKVIISTLFAAIPMILNTILILMFLLLIFSIAGLQLWEGLFLNRCFDLLTGKVHPEDMLCKLICPVEKGFSYQCGKMLTNPN